MCGIWFYLVKQGYLEFVDKDVRNLYESCDRLSHRGPDRSTFVDLRSYGVMLGFHRLSIMDPSTKGDQPFILEDDDHVIYTICNGEIYNFKDLCHKYSIETKSGSDCEVLPHLYKKIGIEALVQEIRAEYAFVICDIDKKTGRIETYISRDHCGIRPLYITGNENEVLLTSELKGSPFLCNDMEVRQFPPRTYLKICNDDESLYKLDADYVQYVDFNKIKPTIFDLEEALPKVKTTFIESVRIRCIADRPIACLLSGGLDSSLVASILARELAKLGKQLYTFSIGLEGSTDEYYAKLVAKHIGSIHVHITVTEDELLEAYQYIHIIGETYDTTTCRALTPQYLVCYEVSQYDLGEDKHPLMRFFKVLFNGDGSDELFGGYLYFHKAPNAEEFHEEGVRLMNNIHVHDVRRADSGISDNGLESRPPYLDIELIKLVLSIDPKLRMPKDGMEKWLLREAFKEGNWLPEEVLYRKKEAFSDGISSTKRSWYQIIQERAEEEFTDEEFLELSAEYEYLPPTTKENLVLRQRFCEYFGYGYNTATVVPYIWMPKKEWVGNITDPSARVLNNYDESTK